MEIAQIIPLLVGFVLYLNIWYAFGFRLVGLTIAASIYVVFVFGPLID